MKEYLSDYEEVLKEQQSSEDGLSSGEAEARLDKYGKNELEKGKKDSLFKRFMFLLENNYTTEHGVRFYAEQLCISTKYLTQISRRVLQKTPKSLIDYKLFSSALGMLDRTDKTIQEVSNALGFPDQSYFSRFFKRCMGVSPVYYRQNPGKVHVPAFEEF